MPALTRKDKFEISHLQYADDTIFVVDGSKENTIAIGQLPMNFELLSSLKVNFDKSSVYGI